VYLCVSVFLNIKSEYCPGQYLQIGLGDSGFKGLTKLFRWYYGTRIAKLGPYSGAGRSTVNYRNRSLKPFLMPHCLFFIDIGPQDFPLKCPAFSLSPPYQLHIEPMLNDRTSRWGCYCSSLYWGGTRFRSQVGGRLYGIRLFPIFLHISDKYGIILKQVTSGAFPRSFPFLRLSFHWTLHSRSSLESVLE
jgi:hypothetical protein